MLFWAKRHASEADLSAFADGALGEAVRVRVEGHVAGCESCRATLDQLRELKASLGALPQATAPRSFAVRQADVAPAPKARAPARGAPALLGGLAMVAMVTFITLVAIDVSGSSSEDSGADGVGMLESSDDRQAESAPQTNDATTEEGAVDAAAEDGAAPSAPTQEVQAIDEAVDEDNGGPDVPLRAAEAATAALALVAGGALIWWSRGRQA